jgi:hypothetical protein
MARELVVLSRAEPGRDHLVAALVAADPSARIAQPVTGGPITLYDRDGVEMFTVQTPLLVRITGEATRLLGVPDEPEPPYCWVDIHAVDEAGGQCAARFADQLSTSLAGVTWTSG